MKINHPTSLFDAFKQVRPYPTGMTEIKEQINGTAFFPGGCGLWEHSLEGSQSRKRGHESLVGTWSNLLKLLSRVPIAKTECFFTNAFPGLRKGRRNTGRSPAWDDGNFVERCRRFFVEEQLAVIQPSALVLLGIEPFRFIATIVREPKINLKQSDGFRAIDGHGWGLIHAASLNGAEQTLDIATITHPCIPSNRRYRSYKGMRGPEAELLILRSISSNK